MIITIATSGGIGGFGLPGQDKSVQTESLAEPLRADVCRSFDPEHLERIMALPSPQSGADRLIYHVTVATGDGATQRFDIPEAKLPPEMLDLIDGL